MRETPRICEDCNQRTDKRYSDRPELCKHYSLQAMENFNRRAMCPWVLKTKEKQGKVRVGQQKGKVW